MNQKMRRFRQLDLASYGLLIVMNLALSVCAFFKDVAFAHYFGTSGTADAYSLGFFIPDMIGNNLLASALGVTCIPIFSRLLIRTNKSVFINVVKRLSLFIFLFTVGLTIVLALGSHLIIEWYGRHLPDATEHQTLLLYREMLPIVVVIPLTFIGVAALQTEKKFKAPAVAPVVYHLFLLISLIVMAMVGITSKRGGLFYGGLTTLAAIIYMGLVWGALFRNWRTVPKVFIKRTRKQAKIAPYLRAISRDLVPYLVILLFTQALLFIERYFASSLESGTLAALNYAYRLVEFPITVFVAAVTTVLLPDFSRDLSANRYNSVMKQMKIALLITVILTGLASLGLFVLRQPIVALLFERGAFDAHSVKQTVTVLTGYSFAIVGQSVSLLGLRYFIASRKMSFPLVAYLIGMLTSILIDCFFVPRVGAIALGFAGSIGATLTAVLFLIGVSIENRNLKG